jgi:hypothetical protein
MSFLFNALQKMYNDLIGRVNSVVHSGKIPEILEGVRGFEQWNETTTSGDHPSIVQVQIWSNCFDQSQTTSLT